MTLHEQMGQNVFALPTNPPTPLTESDVNDYDYDSPVPDMENPRHQEQGNKLNKVPCINCERRKDACYSIGKINTSACVMCAHRRVKCTRRSTLDSQARKLSWLPDDAG
jgi:hypothetical protein